MNERDPTGRSAHAAGAKLDDGKPIVADILRMFAHALWEVSVLGTTGATKYSLGGWLEVDDGIHRYENAEMRHKLKEWMGEEMDTDTDVLHATAEAWNALARLELILREKDQMFDMTREGYKEAKQYLIEINKYEDFLNNNTSVDGFSLIHWANSEKKKEEKDES